MAWVPSNPVNWTALLAAVYTFVKETSGITCVWGDQFDRRPASPYITLKRITSLITKENRVKGWHTAQADAIEVRQVVVTGASLAAYTVTVNATDFTYVKGIGDTEEVIRDGLQALIDAGSEPVTTLAVGTATIQITSDTAGVPVDIAVTDELTTTIVTEVLDRSFVRTVEFTISLNAFVIPADADDVVEDSADLYLERILAAGDSETWVSYLDTNSLALVGWSDPQDISQLDRTRIQSRSTCTLTFRTTSVFTENIGIIETVDFTNEILT